MPSSEEIDNLIKTLKRKKAARKGVITRLTNEFMVILEPSKVEYENILQNLLRYQSEILAIDEEITGLYEEADILSEQAYTDLLHNNDKYINEINSVIQNIKEKYNQYVSLKETKANESFLEAVRNNSLNATDHSYRAKLPTLEIPKFMGDKSSFPSFLDKFNSIIGSREDISKVDKFSYLLKYVQGPALKLIESLPILETNYETALSILCLNYKNQAEINHNLAVKLIKLKHCSESYESIFGFYSELECLLGQIGNNNLDIENSSWLICPLILEKLPAVIVELFQQKLNKTYPTLSEIRENFPSILTLYNSNSHKAKLDSASASATTKSKMVSTIPKKENSYFNKREKREKHATLQAFNTNIAYKCKFCSEAHASKLCETYNNHDARIQRCHQLNLCTRCTGIHNTKECRTRLKFPCRNCHKNNHVISMCPKSLFSSSPNSENKNVNSNSNKKKEIQSGNLLLNDVTTNTSMLLPTVTLNLITKKGSYPVRAYIDTCSQQTFVNKNLLQKLEIPISSSQTNNVKVTPFVGSQCEMSEHTTDLNIRVGEKDHLITSLVTETPYTGSCHVPGLSKLVAQLKTTYVLADKEIKSDIIDNIDLLLGVDAIDLVVLGTIKINNGLALKTSEGIALFGNIEKYNDINSDI